MPPANRQAGADSDGPDSGPEDPAPSRTKKPGRSNGPGSAPGSAAPSTQVSEQEQEDQGTDEESAGPRKRVTRGSSKGPAPTQPAASDKKKGAAKKAAKEEEEQPEDEEDETSGSSESSESSDDAADSDYGSPVPAAGRGRGSGRGRGRGGRAAGSGRGGRGGRGRGGRGAKETGSAPPSGRATPMQVDSGDAPSPSPAADEPSSALATRERGSTVDLMELIEDEGDAASHSDAPPVLVTMDLGPGQPPVPMSGAAFAHLISAYNILRAFSWQLRLSPFSLQELIVGLASGRPSVLVDELHVSILRALAANESARDRKRRRLDLAHLDLVRAWIGAHASGSRHFWLRVGACRHGRGGMAGSERGRCCWADAYART